MLQQLVNSNYYDIFIYRKNPSHLVAFLYSQLTQKDQVFLKDKEKNLHVTTSSNSRLQLGGLHNSCNTKITDVGDQTGMTGIALIYEMDLLKGGR